MSGRPGGLRYTFMFEGCSDGPSRFSPEGVQAMEHSAEVLLGIDDQAAQRHCGGRWRTWGVCFDANDDTAEFQFDPASRSKRRPLAVWCLRLISQHSRRGRLDGDESQ